MMETVFIPTWSMSVLLVILCAFVIWCALNASDTNWDVVSGNHDEPRKCGDQVEIETEHGTRVLTCTKDAHPEREGHVCETCDGDMIDTWKWVWAQ